MGTSSASMIVPVIFHSWLQRVESALAGLIKPSRRMSGRTPELPPQRIAAGHELVLVINPGDDEWSGATAQALADAGYQVRTVARFSDEPKHPDLIILFGTVSPPDWEKLRQVTNTPIMVLLQQPDEAAVLRALDAGMDDCQATSIGKQEIAWRVRALMRRAPVPAQHAA
jgi:hypothetical protein